MGDPWTFGFGAYFSDAEPTPLSMTSTQFSAQDPLPAHAPTSSASSTCRVTAPPHEPRHRSGFPHRTNELLLDWRGQSTTLIDVLSYSDAEAFNATMLAGADLILSGAGSDRLEGLRRRRPDLGPRGRRRGERESGNDTMNGGRATTRSTAARAGHGHVHHAAQPFRGDDPVFDDGQPDRSDLAMRPCRRQ